MRQQQGVALSGDAALPRLTSPDRLFGAHHCVVYTANVFVGSDIDSLAKWLCSFLPSASTARDLAMTGVHHPFYFSLLFAIPLPVYIDLSRPFFVGKRM